MKTIRATTPAQKAGSYYVRIQAMAVKHHISLEEEIDEIDASPDTKYILVLDDVLPVATCRMFPASSDAMQIGRIVVLPEYRRQGLGSHVVTAAEDWARELGYKKIVLDSRDNKVDFYKRLGYTADYDKVIDCDVFDCVFMEKQL